LNYYRATSIIRSKAIPLGLSIFKPANKIKLKLPWWVKITTAKPKCVYYFGPFASQNEAVESQSGYLEDLKAEKAQEINIEIKQDLPKLLTIPEE
jgi:hypothetical protein